MRYLKIRKCHRLLNKVFWALGTKSPSPTDKSPQIFCPEFSQLFQAGHFGKGVVINSEHCDSQSKSISKTNIHSTITEWSTVLPTSEINSIIYFSFIGHKTKDDLLNQKLQGIPHWQTGGKTFNKLVPVPYLTGQLPTFLKLWIKTYKDHCLLKTNKITLDYKWSGNFPLS